MFCYYVYTFTFCIKCRVIPPHSNIQSITRKLLITKLTWVRLLLKYLDIKFALKVFLLGCLIKYIINQDINYFKGNIYRKKDFFFFCPSTVSVSPENVDYCLIDYCLIVRKYSSHWHQNWTGHRECKTLAGN